MAEPITILGIAGSLRKGSWNRGALRAAQKLLPEGARLEICDLHGIPPFNQDEEGNPHPKVAELKQRIRAADGPAIVTHARVTALHHADGRITHVRVRVGDDKKRVAAKHFVLTSGGLGALRLLLLAQRETPALFGGADGPLGRFYMGHLTGSIAALLYVYAIRFLAVSHGNLSEAMARRGPSMLDAGRVLGSRGFDLFLRVDLPTLAPSIAAAATLVFVEIIKELPATLLLRPLGVETLATLVYAKANSALFAEAALPALAIVATGMVPVVLATQLGARRKV